MQEIDGGTPSPPKDGVFLSSIHIILFNAVLNLLLCLEVLDVGPAGEDRILNSDMPGWEISYQMYPGSTTSSAAGSFILKINYENGEVKHGGKTSAKTLYKEIKDRTQKNDFQ
mgnify:CR=1 FL=1